MKVKLAVVDIGNGEISYEIQTEYGYSLSKKELEEIVKRVNEYDKFLDDVIETGQFAIKALEEHKKEIEQLQSQNRELTEILKPLVLRHNASEEFAILNNVEDQFCKAFNVDMVVVEKGWIEKVKKILEKCEGVE